MFSRFSAPLHTQTLQFVVGFRDFLGNFKCNNLLLIFKYFRTVVNIPNFDGIYVHVCIYDPIVTSPPPEARSYFMRSSGFTGTTKAQMVTRPRSRRTILGFNGFSGELSQSFSWANSASLCIEFSRVRCLWHGHFVLGKQKKDIKTKPT